MTYPLLHGLEDNYKVKTQSTGIVEFQTKPENPISLGSLQLSIKLKIKKKNPYPNIKQAECTFDFITWYFDLQMVKHSPAKG